EKFFVRRAASRAPRTRRIYRQAQRQTQDHRRSRYDRDALSALKNFIFRILGKDPEAIVVSFASGDPALVERMFAEIQRLEPTRRHFLVSRDDFSRSRFRRFRIGLAVVLFDGDRQHRPLRRAAFFLAPTKVLAYNRGLERHHLRLSTLIASRLFLAG